LAYVLHRRRRGRLAGYRRRWGGAFDRRSGIVDDTTRGLEINETKGIALFDPNRQSHNADRGGVQDVHETYAGDWHHTRLGGYVSGY
jgi:hypothetical protein